MSQPGNQYNPREWPTKRRRQICQWWLDVVETEDLTPAEFVEQFGLRRRTLIAWLRDDHAELGVSLEQIRRWSIVGRVGNNRRCA